jgi:hypothetical protein
MPPGAAERRPHQETAPQIASDLAKDQLNGIRGVDHSPLRATTEDAIAEAKARGVKLTWKELTVMSPKRDPFRLDTPANHRNAKWLADAIADIGIMGEIHLRGVHYAISTGGKVFIKPNGERYLNIDDDWEWLQDVGMKAARWLGYIPWERIFDKHNAEPFIYEIPQADPWGFLSIGLDVEIPSIEDIEPKVGLAGFHSLQPYKIIMIAEKSSVKNISLPIARRYGADLYIPKGDISDPTVHRVARNGHEDGRELVVIYFSDCDPGGWNMPIVIARKLQAFKATLFPDLEFRQYRAAVTPAQVRKYKLPELPLKPEEKRGDTWKEQMGVEQTELDALVQFHPDVLRQLAENAITPFYDKTLDRRVREVREHWEQEAQRIVDADENLHNRLDQVRAEAAARLLELQAQIDSINDALRFDLDDFDVPDEPPVPEPEIDEDQPEPLVDSRWSFLDQIRALKESRAYENGGEA